MQAQRRADTRCVLTVVTVLLAVTGLGCSPSARLQDESLRSDLGSNYAEIFDEYRQSIPAVMREQKIPGLSITVADHEGILWTAGFGRTGDWGRPVTPDTLFGIGSISKTFTATAVMIAVQDGLLDLDTPIAEYLPGFGGVHTTARDLSRFMRFFLNRGTLDGQTILKPRFLDAMCTTSPTFKKYGLCVIVREKHDSYSLAHNGGGFGILTRMICYPEYGVGCIVLTNSQTHDRQHMKITDAILDRLITQKVVTKNTSGAVPTADQFIGKDTRLSGFGTRVYTGLSFCTIRR